MRTLFAFAMLLGAWIVPAQPAHALGCILLGCDCTVTASDMDFPDFNPLLGGSHNAVGSIHVSCVGLLSVGAGVVVQLDDGQWGSFAARRMRSDGGQLLDYNIYTTGAHSVIWGNGLSGTQTVTLNGGLITLGAWSRSRDIFGRLTVNPSQQPGEYTDTVVVRVIW